MSSPFAARYWVGHVAMMVLLAAAILLGVWQIHVYERHRTEAAIDRTTDRPVALADALGPDQAFPGDAVGRPVSVTGSWLPQDTVLVSGQQQDGRDGYWVVTPVSVAGTTSALPIVLGWTPDAAQTPDPPSGSARLVAWLQPSQEDEGTAGSASGDTAGGYDVLPQLRTAALVQDVDQDLYDGYAVARGGEVGLAQAELPQQPDAGAWTSIRNLLYGIQWLVFGGFAVLIWWRWLADARAADAALAAGGDRSESDEAPVGTVRA